MEILTSVNRLYISFKSLVNNFVYSFSRAALLLLVEVQNHTVPVRERGRLRVKTETVFMYSRKSPFRPSRLTYSFMRPHFLRAPQNAGFFLDVKSSTFCTYILVLINLHFKFRISHRCGPQIYFCIGSGNDLNGSASHFHSHYGTPIFIVVLRLSYDCTKFCACLIHSRLIYHIS